MRPSWIASSSGTADRPVCGIVDSSTPQTPAMYSRCAGFSRSRAPGQLIALLPLFPRALAVALPGDHRVAAAFAPDPAGGHHQVDARPCSSRRPSSGARCRARAGGSSSPAGPHISAARTIIDAGTLAIDAAYSGV